MLVHRRPASGPVRARAGCRAASARRLACFLVGGAVILVLGTLAGEPVRRPPRTSVVGGVHVLDAMLGDVGRVAGRPTRSPPRSGCAACIGLVGAVVVLGARPTCCSGRRADTRTLDAADEARVRTLLRDFGDHDSLGYFATRRDKSVVWDTGDAGHRAGRGLLPGGRLGQPGQRQPDRRPAALGRRDRGAGVEQARANGWSLAVMGAGEEGAAAYTEAGLTALRDRRRGDRRPADVLAERPGHEGRSGSRCPGCSGAATPRAWSGTRRSTAADFADAERRRRRSGAATAATSAASRWRSVGSATRSTAQCVLVEAHDADGQLRGVPQLRPVGPQRAVARPDAPRPDRRQRPGRADGRLAGRAGRARSASAGCR